jgi:hypothetical protein
MIEEIEQCLLSHLGVRKTEDKGNLFFYCDPKTKIPFASIVVNDRYDQFSKLGRDGVFRLNLALSKGKFLELFPRPTGHHSEPLPVHDYTAVDRLMPHPEYGRMWWVCILNPSASRFAEIRALIADAYEFAIEKYDRVRRAAQQT